MTGKIKPVTPLAVAATTPGMRHDANARRQSRVAKPKGQYIDDALYHEAQLVRVAINRLRRGESADSVLAVLKNYVATTPSREASA